MAEKPIQIKEVRGSINSTREELYAENSNKILGTKGFVFSNYKTDRQKVKEYTLKHNEDELFQKIRDAKIQNYQIIQPTMRFKPRTDLERICDVLGEFHGENQGKDIIFNQLSTVGLNITKQANQSKDEAEDDEKDYESNDEYYNNNDTQVKNSKNNQKQLQTETNHRSHFIQKKPLLKRIDNSEAKKIYPDLYNKTYFKATENFSLFKNTCLLDHSQLNSQNNRNKTKYNYYTHTHSNKRSFKKNNLNNDGSKLNQQNEEINNPTDLIGILNICTSNATSLKDKEMNLLKSLDNIDLFTQSIKENKEIMEHFDGDKLSKVRDMAFIVKETNYINDNKIALSKRRPGISNIVKTQSFRDNTSTTSNNLHPMYNMGEDDMPNKVEEKIKINGEEFNKNDFNKISKRILFNCNWIHKKNKVAKDSLKARNGKLMCTGGLTVEEFEKKYKL